MEAKRWLLAAAAAVATAACLDAGSGEPPVARIDVSGDAAVGESLTFDGSRSYDPDDGTDEAITSWEWSVASAPPGATATITTSGTGAVASLRPDVAGKWNVELVVRDRAGMRSSPASVELTVEEDGPGPSPTPTPGTAKSLVFESDWSNDGDLDIHVIHVTAGGSFMQTPYDCFAANPNPDWGPSGASGDCEVVVDAQAYGTEKVVIETPEDGATYRVTVWNYSNQGGTNVYVRITLGGETVFDDSAYLATPGYGWHAAEITYPFASVDVIDETFLWY